MPPFHRQVAALYEVCTQLRLVFHVLHRQVETAHEIAMNAAVTAGHLGRHAAVCTEIAQQIHVTARRMTQSRELVREQINQMMNQVLTMLIQVNRLTKYEESLEHLQGSSNQILVRDVIQDHSARIAELAEGIQANGQRTAATLRMIGVQHQRLFMTLSALEIEAIDLDEAQASVVLSLVERLNELVDAGADSLEQTKGVLRRVKKYAVYIQEASHKEFVCEKVRAA